MQACLLASLEEIEVAFWGGEAGPGADMRQLVAGAPGPEAYADIPKVGCCWPCFLWQAHLQEWTLRWAWCLLRAGESG